MDDVNDDFEDLLSEADLLQETIPVSLTDRAPNLAFAEDADHQCTTCHTRTAKSSCTPANCRTQLGDDRDAVVPSLGANHTLSVSSDEAVCGAAIVDRIEAVFEDMVNALLNEKSAICIKLKSRSSRSRIATANTGINPMRRVYFPGKTADEAWRFTVVVRIMELMHEALRHDAIVSKRDIYYRDPALFGSQAHVDRYVDDIAFTFGVNRSALNVTAVAKGLVAGAFSVCRKDGSTFNAAVDREGILVPNVKDVLSVDMTAVRWILAVEKEATFRSIAASEFWGFVSRQGIILTGKGYPDLASRAFLRFLSMPTAQNGFAAPPVFGLVDYDPDGIAIVSIYKYGSKTLAHETDKHHVTQLQWLGLRSEHLRYAINDSSAAQGLLPLTARDRSKAVKMLEHFSCFSGSEPALFKRELQAMLMLNTKAELQLFDATQTSMTNFLTSNLI